MIKIFASILLVLSLFNASCQQSGDIYNEKNYVEHHRSLDHGLYIIVLYYNGDTSFSIHKAYTDSLYQDTSLIAMHFLHHDLMNGPVEHYWRGKLLSKGFMKEDKRHGEFSFYEDNDKVDRRQFYNMGVKVGVWEDYYPTGILFKKVYYNEGKFVKQEIYSRKEGKLVRTEYEESWQY